MGVLEIDKAKKGSHQARRKVRTQTHVYWRGWYISSCSDRSRDGSWFSGRPGFCVGTSDTVTYVVIMWWQKTNERDYLVV